MTRRPIADGRPAAIAGLVAAAAAAIVATTTADSLVWLVGRVEIAALVLLGLGVVFASERLVAVAVIPGLAGSMVAITAVDDAAWGRSMLIGGLWFVAMELALSSIERRGAVSYSSVVTRQRVIEVATVVLLGAMAAGGGMLASWVAPERTLLLRSVLFGAVVAGLVVVLRHLRATSEERADTTDDQLEAATKRL